MRVVRTGALLIATWLVTGCQQFHAPGPELALILKSSETASTRTSAICAIQSPAMSGGFRSIVVREGRPPFRTRLQLLPDFGGKILDIVAAPEDVRISWSYLPTATGNEGANHLALAIGISLLESSTPLTKGRVIGIAKLGNGYLLDVRPAFRMPDLQVHVLVSVTGTIIERRYRLGRLRWAELPGQERRFYADQFEWVIQQSSTDMITTDSTVLFTVDGPQWTVISATDGE